MLNCISNLCNAKYRNFLAPNLVRLVFRGHLTFVILLRRPSDTLACSKEALPVLSNPISWSKYVLLQQVTSFELSTVCKEAYEAKSFSTATASATARPLCAAQICMLLMPQSFAFLLAPAI